MAKMEGKISAKLDGKIYSLRLTQRGVATLQDEFGDDFMKPLQEAATAERLPPMKLCLRVVELALGKDANDFDGDLADELLTADLGIVGRIFAAAFPSDETVEDTGQTEDVNGKKQNAAGA